MPTTISNPASFSSVRNAFNTEGYGISTSFFAYRQGGGIVPSTSAFNAIGAGTGGDPLQLSQFSGFTVPALTLDTQTVTVGYRQIAGGYPTYGTEDIYGFESGLIGSISDGTSNIYGGASITNISHVSSSGGNKSLFFVVSGSRANSGWTTMDIAGSTYSRSSATYTDFGTTTEWAWLFTAGTNPFGTTVGATKTVTWT